MPDNEQENVKVHPEPPKEEKDELHVVEEPTATDVSEPEAPKKSKHKNIFERSKDWALNHKKISIPVAILVVILVILGLPFTRYQTLGLVYKKNFVVSAYDASTNTPVSGATVTSGSVSASTNGSGKATLKLPVGKHTFTITKKYYKDNQLTVIVPILNQKTTPSVGLEATGRQVKITVTNVITKKPLSDVGISVSETQAKTDKDGNATVVLPASLSAVEATLSLGGYNNSKVMVTISNKEVAQNSFTLTPAGKVYFLSKRTGSLNVMKINYDGTSAEVAVQGTSYEDSSTSKLLQSPNGKYVALLTQRSADDKTPQLYLVSTADDKVFSIDSATAYFSLVGWEGDNLIYTVNRTDLSAWQAGKNKIKSYTASTGKTNLLDQTTASGDSKSYIYENYRGLALFKNQIVYVKYWYACCSYTSSSLLTSKTASLNTVDPTGGNHKTVSTYPAADYYSLSRKAVNIIDLRQSVYSGGQHFYEYSLGTGVKDIEDIADSKFYSTPVDYVLSADMSRAVWSDLRDGKHTILIGDTDGAGSSSVLELSDYTSMNWANDDYLLLDKKGSEIYIVSTAGGDATKVTDYQSGSWGSY